MDTSDSILEAMLATPREMFVPDDMRDYADQDRPLPIGYGQTISQPTTVRRMLTWLDPRPGDKILDVGSGSGWTTAILSKIVGASGHVHAVELVPELVAFGKANCAGEGVRNASFHRAGQQIGYPAQAPYDRILVSARGSEIPQDLLDQLRPGGKMVIPIGESIYEITKNESDLDITEHPGYIFVPLLP